MSFCIMQTSAPYKMPITETTSMMVTILWRAAGSSGSSGNEKRINPYVPIFNRTPARMTDPAVGASVCASGSQVWNGNIGTLIANAKKKAQNSSTCQRVSNCDAEASSVGISKVLAPALKYSARIPSSIITEPTSVYRKNLMAAYKRRSLPHTPIRKYMGTSITSQNM